MPSSSNFTYLGPEGTFTEAALRTLPEAATRVLVPMISVPAALDAVRRGEAGAARGWRWRTPSRARCRSPSTNWPRANP
jgi:hypothetical protein